MAESIRIKETDLDIGELEKLLKKIEATVFKDEGKRITGFTLADPNGPDAGHNLIIIDASATPPPFGWVLREFVPSLNENQLALKLIEFEDARQMRLRCYGNALVSGKESVAAIFDPASPLPAGTITVSGKMSTFGGPDDTTMLPGENLAWIENEQQAAAYPGFFLPPQPGIGYGRRLRTEKFYLACRWDYSVTPKRFLAQPTTLCTVTNPRTGKSVEARPIDFGPNTTTTGRVVDLSKGVATALGLDTNDTCDVVIPTPQQIPPPKAPAPTTAAASGKRRVVFLTGDYTLRHVRQRQATAEGCVLTVDFHFNSNGATAKGGEVYYRTDHDPSRDVAKRVMENFQALGLPNHGDPIKSATEGEGRAAFINSYTNMAVLLEPLFVSNSTQAEWLHTAGNLDKLADAVAKAIRASTQDGDAIGLSIGHLGKDSNPSDRGARCTKGDMEATHGEAMARAVAKLLET